MARLNDVAWQRILDAETLARIEREGFVEFSAKQLKEKGGREPRLLAKHDFSASRPEIFQEHNLSIFPIRRDGYVVGNFDVYEPFPETVTPLKTLPVPQGVESLDFDNLSSETLVLNAAVIAGVLQDFLGVDKLHATVAGRMSTGTVSMRLRGEELVVDRAQMEIDGGFEAPECLVLIECKNHISPDFNIRQLYLPFRRFSQQLGKEVVPVYLVYSNGIFHLYRYRFSNAEDFRSIQLEAAARYMLGESELNTESVKAVLKRIAPRESEIPFPQADSFARVVSLWEMLPLPKAEIPERFGFSHRQADYYLNAGRYLGLMRIEDELVVGIELADTRDGRNLQLIEALASRPVFHEMVAAVAEKQRMLSKKEAVAIMEAADLNISGSTLPRRAQTVVAWSQWVAELFAPQQLSLL